MAKPAKPVYNTEPTPIADQEVLSRVLDARADSMGMLADRWQDEKEYEDWSDYENVMKGWVPEGFTFERTQKSPFGMIFSKDGRRFYFGCQGKSSIVWKRVS
jgi:hypothetical protein